MRAVVARSFGPPDVLVVEEVPRPEPGPGEVLIAVAAAAVNFSDVMRRSGAVYPFPTALPFVPGGEVAGTVAALGPGVEGPPVGTRVLALVGGDGSTGYAEYAVAGAGQVVPVPDGLGLDEAASTVIAGLTALLALQETGRLRPGESVLVQAAAGGVGGFAVQLARLLGAGTVIGAAGSPEKREAALALGADHAVDYGRPGWGAQVRELTGGRGVDVVLEVGGGVDESLAALAPFGRLVVLGMAGRTPLALGPEAVRRLFYDPAPNQSLHAFNLGVFFGARPEVAGPALGALLEHVAAGRVRVRVDHVLPLAEAERAHRLLEARRTTGKIVLRPGA